ncbi:MAG: 2-oxoacid:acceptor oxidoreductase family protein [Alphaproteobacteria bacterium]|jgi:pyruvate ferredoxin oxidoreductase gamma subunit|nr:2-oxoacid:acceptor oxidoreductase family protein [Alphaproteobacteria bacterium]MDP6516631.1 2-oxoacid:acceptor oxidoreductase family protein [Alphaproteobacteria bacterium]
MYRIRFHGRGGQGMKTASRMLGTAFFLEGYEVQDAPRYGAERRGAPIFAYVRADKRLINERGVIVNPDLVVVADDTLVAVPAAGVLVGLGDRTVVLIDSAEPAIAWTDRLKIPGPVIILPAAEPHAQLEAASVGAECAGAAARLAGVISRANLEAAVCRELAGMARETVAKNVDRALASFERMEPHLGLVKEGGPPSAIGYAVPNWIDLPGEGVSLSGPAIYGGATSVQVRTGLWRTLRPVIDYGRCRKCNWVCGSFCPDSAISVAEDGRPVIDLDHCKGCMICVAQCPPHAIEATSEIDAAATAMKGETA